MIESSFKSMEWTVLFSWRAAQGVWSLPHEAVFHAYMYECIYAMDGKKLLKTFTNTIRGPISGKIAKGRKALTDAVCLQGSTLVTAFGRGITDRLIERRPNWRFVQQIASQVACVLSGDVKRSIDVVRLAAYLLYCKSIGMRDQITPEVAMTELEWRLSETDILRAYEIVATVDMIRNRTAPSAQRILNELFR